MNLGAMARQMEPTTSNYVNDSIIDEDNLNEGCADSGYSSHGNLSHVSSINASALRSSVSHCLPPIYENVPISFYTSTAELTPNSQNIRKINEFHISSPNTPLKRSLPCTPVKVGSPKKRRLDGKSNSKAYNIYVDENGKSRDIANFDISPIKSINVLQEKNGKFERKGSFSSTPIYEDSLQKSMSVSKTEFFTNAAEPSSLVIRRTKSFSPSKRRWLMNRCSDINTKTTPIPEDEELSSDPARRSIKRLLCRQDAIPSVEEPTTPQSFDITATDLLSSDIKSPVNYKLPTTETPVKKFRRNLSFNLQSPKKELVKTLRSTVPSSPLKQRSSAIKRTSTANDSSAAKRPLFDISPLLPKRKYFSNKQPFDILSNLAEINTAMGKILSFLEPKDIRNMYNVSVKWRSIIKNDAVAFNKRSKYLIKLAKNKENLQRKPLLRQRAMTAVSKAPLTCANSNVMNSSLKRASTQPSIIRDPFLLIGQKKQRRTRCASCGHPSIIHENKNDEIFENYIPFQPSNQWKYDYLRDFAKPKYEFAVCTRCKHKFCMNCTCEFHGNDECPIKLPNKQGQSDEEEDEIYSTGSRPRSSKHNLRRLCRLDKV